ncbi:hypothetical protein [Thalassoglobus neptunius]|nr:hypothetical protein [Thalassoglobus neptunius]
MSRLLLATTAVLLFIPQLCSYPEVPDDQTVIGLPKVYSGDEPHYYIVLYSLLFDGDLNLQNNYQNVHQGGMNAGSRMSGSSLDHHTIWFDDGVMTRWNDIYLGWDEPWDLDENGHHVPTPKANPRDQNGHHPEYSTHPAGYPLFLAALTFGISDPVLLESAAVYLSWIATLWAMSSMMSLLQTFQTSTWTCAVIVSLIFLGTPIWHYSRAMFSEIWLLAFTVAAFSAMVNNSSGFWSGTFIGLGTLMNPPFALLGIVLMAASIR